MAAMELPPDQECHRLLGKAVNKSSLGSEGDAALALKEAFDSYDDLPYAAWSNMQAAKTVEKTGSEFRRYLEKAQQILEGDQ